MEILAILEMIKSEMSSKMNENCEDLKMLSDLCCSSCNLQYVIKDLMKRNKFPMLLHCGHSMCYFCIQQNLKISDNITCKHCGFVSCLEAGEQSSKDFPLNVYLMGSLFIAKSLKLKDQKLSFMTDSCRNFNYVVKEKSNALKSDSRKTCEECSFAAVWYCENCTSYFCEICWSRVHGSAKSLMKHCKSLMSVAESKNDSLKKCSKHENQNLEFFCQGCSTIICSHCAIQQHQGEGHFLVTLKNKNLEIGNVKTAAEEARKICKRMKQTLEKVNLTENSCETPEKLLSELEIQIKRSFSRVHGILQLEENRLLRKLQENSNERGNRIRTLGLQLKEQIENVERLLTEVEIVERGSECGDLSDLETRLKEVKNMPCYLISRNPCSGEAKVSFDERLIEFIQTYCTMDLPSNEVFELRSCFDLPEDYAIEPLQECNAEEIFKLQQRTEEESRISDVDTTRHWETKRNFHLESKGAPIFQEKRTYAVRVSYIKNPGEFYVTLNSQKSKLQAMESRASILADASADFPERVAKDEIYLAKYKVDNRWYRARVKKVFPSKKIGEEDHVKIYYLDYGNSETVPISRLRSLPPDMTELPLAIKCKLFDCVPKNEKWCLESTKTMEKILNNYTATMYIMKVNRDCLEVDLSVVYPEGEIGRDIVSVRDALLFLELSSFVHGYKTPRNGNALKYFEQRLPSVGETFSVVVTHVNSPSDFFVLNAEQHLSYLYKLSTDLQVYCSDNSVERVIYNPAVGMPCAALFPVNQLWYRARIVDVPGKKMVTVFYVDFGSRKTIRWTWIRALKDSFLKLPPLALNCDLTGIAPTDSSWCVQAKSCLEKCLSIKSCQVHVDYRIDSKLGVFLYKQEKQEDICLNALLVDKGFAITTSSKYAWMSKSKGKELKEEEKPEDFILKMGRAKESNEEEEKEEKEKVEVEGEGEGEREEKGNSEVERKPRRKWRKSKVSQNRSGGKSTTKKFRELLESEKENCGEGFSTENIFQMKVKILSAESPSSIHVTFPSLMHQFQELQSNLNQFYKNSPLTAVEWTEGSICAIYVSEENSWYRASLLSLLPDGEVKVFLKDVAQIILRTTSDLRVLDPSFNKYPSCSVKCHLAGIEPAAKEWPGVSSEFLMNELQKHKEVYMTKCGKIENKSLPVELWVHKVFPTGALEPSPKEWITINRLLVKEGLAVPKRPVTSALSEKCSEDLKEEENDGEIYGLLDGNLIKEESSESVAFPPSFFTHWLPPEPLEESHFIGMPTYVDLNAFIYIYDIEKDGEKLNKIRESLLNELENSVPNSESNDNLWSQGQPCIARYHLDSCWYRGLVVEANENGTFDVLFVDYGNVEKCESHDLRPKSIKVHDIPILSHKFQLHGIAPFSDDGKWPVAATDVLHYLVVDKKCKVQVVKPSVDPEEPSLITLQLSEHEIEVGSFLVEQGLASFTSSISDDSEGATSDASSHKNSPSPPSPTFLSSNINESCEL